MLHQLLCRVKKDLNRVLGNGTGLESKQHSPSALQAASPKNTFATHLEIQSRTAE